MRWVPGMLIPSPDASLGDGDSAARFHYQEWISAILLAKLFIDNNVADVAD